MDDLAMIVIAPTNLTTSCLRVIAVGGVTSTWYVPRIKAVLKATKADLGNPF